MPHHSVTRDARGNVAGIDGSCRSDECPVEDVDDDGGITYLCPVTGETLAEVEPVDVPDLPDELTPDTVDEVAKSKRRRRRR